MVPPTTNAVVSSQRKRQPMDASTTPASSPSNKKGKVLDTPFRLGMLPAFPTSAMPGGHLTPQLNSWGFMGMGMPPGTMPAGGMPFGFANPYMMNPYMLNPFMMANPYMMAGMPGMMAGMPGMMAGVPGMMAGVPGMMAGVPGMMAGVPGMMGMPSNFALLSTTIPPTVSANSAPAATSSKLIVQPPAALPLSMAQLQVAYSNSRMADQPVISPQQSTTTPHANKQLQGQQFQQQHHGLNGRTVSTMGLSSCSEATPGSSGGSSHSTPSTTHLFATHTDSRQGDSEPDILDDDAFAAFISAFLGSAGGEEGGSPQASQPTASHPLISTPLIPAPCNLSTHAVPALEAAAVCPGDQVEIFGDRFSSQVGIASDVIIDVQACLVDRED